MSPPPDKPRLSTPLSLANLDLQALLEQAAREQADAHARRLEVVLVVHGTFANPERDAQSRWHQPQWWQSSGSFPKALDAALERHGSRARCIHTGRAQAHRLEDWRSTWGGWSGANSEVERRRAAYELAEHIRALQRDPGIARIHIVGHSHGGNVARRALRYLNDPHDKLGTVICLGTPFLHFADKAAWRRWVSRVHWPMLMVLVVLAAVFWLVMMPRAGSGADEFSLYVLGAVAGAALYSLWRYARTSEASSDDPPAIAVRFERDEAILLLSLCAKLTAEPHLYLRDMLGGPAAARAVDRRDRWFARGDDWYDRVVRVVSGVWRLGTDGFARVSNAWNGPVCRGAEHLTSLAYRVPLLGGVSALLLILAFRPYRPPLRPFLSSRMPRLASLFFHSISEEAELSVQDTDPYSLDDKKH
jgi:hypothetical protein